MIFSKLAACTSQPVEFNEHLSNRGRLTGLRKSLPVNFWQWCCGNLATVLPQIMARAFILSSDF